jgi:uracil-DNA glycosylase family protein
LTQKRSAADFLPETLTVAGLREAAADCRGCDLYKDATQTVFGDGPERAKVMFVGEQPGDSEDTQGRPFVGPAGKLLRRAMAEARIPEGDAYVTNAVKHFKYVWRGKHRIHATPKRIEVRACTPWLEAEMRAVQPTVVVALGATAAQALLGPTFRLTQHRGEFVPASFAQHVIATLHPAAILRTPDQELRNIEMAGFIADLKLVSDKLAA